MLFLPLQAAPNPTLPNPEPDATLTDCGLFPRVRECARCCFIRRPKLSVSGLDVAQVFVQRLLLGPQEAEMHELDQAGKALPELRRNNLLVREGETNVIASVDPKNM